MTTIYLLMCLCRSNKSPFIAFEYIKYIQFNEMEFMNRTLILYIIKG